MKKKEIKKKKSRKEKKKQNHRNRTKSSHQGDTLLDQDKQNENQIEQM